MRSSRTYGTRETDVVESTLRSAGSSVRSNHHRSHHVERVWHDDGRGVRSEMMRDLVACGTTAFVARREVGAFALPTQASVRTRYLCAQPPLLHEHPLPTASIASLDKVFASAWLDADHLLVGTKDNRVRATCCVCRCLCAKRHSACRAWRHLRAFQCDISMYVSV
jgi:hypothetical protein